MPPTSNNLKVVKLLIPIIVFLAVILFLIKDNTSLNNGGKPNPSTNSGSKQEMELPSDDSNASRNLNSATKEGLSSPKVSQDPNDLPEDLQAQLREDQLELPADLEEQLSAPPPELPEDLRVQLDAPPPPLPDDIKESMAVPPKTVTIEEVNTPPGEE